MSIYNKEELANALKEKVEAFNNHISNLNEEAFEATPGGKWSAGQNLDHLIRSIRPLQLAYSLPKFILKLLFGKANRPSRSYEELIVKYETKLKAGGRASGQFIPPIISFEKKENLMKNYDQHKEKLSSKILNQKEEYLELYVLPHPLLGKLTLREMLYFTIYHNEHHLRILKERDQ